MMSPGVSRLLVPELDNRLGAIRRRIRSVAGPSHYADPIFGFDKFCDSHLNKRALVSFLPSELLIALQTGKPRQFNPTGAALEMTKALNELGYVVDIVDYRDTEFIPKAHYELFVGHGNYNFEKISNCLNSSAIKVCYSTGCYWNEFRRQSRERYDRFARSRGRRIETFVRQIVDEEYPSKQADLLICLGKMTAESYATVSKLVVPINNAAYYDDRYDIGRKDFEAARNNFVYLGGTGNIQKGLDLLIEAFVQMPDLHLYIFSPLERELIQGYPRELRQANIHYVHHYRFSPSKTSQLWMRSNYTLYTGFNSGQSTALVGSLSYGLIPVVNRESDIEVNGNGYRIPSNSVEDIIGSIRKVSHMSTDWYKQAAEKTIAQFRAQHTAAVFRSSFRRAISSLT